MKIYIGIPFYGGACAQFVSALLKTHLCLHLAGHEVEVDMHSGCSILPKARNEIVQRFMDSGFDALVFLDNDMAWEVEDLFNLINSDHPVSAIDYRRKTEEVVYLAQLTGKEQDGWKQATAAGTGLMCIKREVIAEMIQAYPETRYTDKNKTVFALFDFGIHEGRYWGEDFTFCRRWVSLGGEIAVWPGKTSHIGPYAFKG